VMLANNKRVGDVPHGGHRMLDDDSDVVVSKGGGRGRLIGIGEGGRGPGRNQTGISGQGASIDSWRKRYEEHALRTGQGNVC